MKQAIVNTQIVLIVLLVFAGALYSETEQPSQRKEATGPPPSIEDHVSGMKKLDGFVPLYWDEQTGKLWMEISRFDTEILYANGLTAGLGSNDIGLDRGQNGGSRIVRFERIGPKVLMVQPNTSFRAKSDNPAEVRAVEDAFARSVLWGFTVAAETGGRVLVDATGLFLRDATNAGPRLGNYRIDPARSAIHMPQTKAFPKNTEVDVVITFARQRSTPGRGNARGPREGPTRVGTEISTGHRRWRSWRRIVHGDRCQRDTRGRCSHTSAAPLLRRATRAGIQASSDRSPRRLRWHAPSGLRRSPRRVDEPTLDSPPSTREDRSIRRSQ